MKDDFLTANIDDLMNDVIDTAEIDDRDARVTAAILKQDRVIIDGFSAPSGPKLTWPEPVRKRYRR